MTGIVKKNIDDVPLVTIELPFFREEIPLDIPHRMISYMVISN